MIRLTIDSLHFEADAKIKTYIHEKIGKLDTFVPGRARTSVHSEVKLIGPAGRGKRQYTCEVILHVPHETIVMHASAGSMVAAIDNVEDKIKTRLRKYKQKHQVRQSRNLIRNMFDKLQKG